MNIYRNSSFFQNTLEDEEDKDGDFDKMFSDTKDVPDEAFFGSSSHLGPRHNSSKRAESRQQAPRNLIPAMPKIPPRTFSSNAMRPPRKASENIPKMDPTEKE